VNPTRRQIVRTAATTAWAAPVIVAGSAAPAYAGSPNGGVDVVDLLAARDGSVGTVSLALENNTGAPVGDTLVTVNVAGVPIPSSPVLSAGSAADGWSFSQVSNTVQGFFVSCARTENLPAGDTTPDLIFTFAAGALGAGTVAANVTNPAGAGQNDPGATTY
jgi:hypothetical protein